MRFRPAALVVLAPLGLLAGCGGAIDDPAPADAQERQLLRDAAEMLPPDGPVAPERAEAAPARETFARTD